MNFRQSKKLIFLSSLALFLTIGIHHKAFAKSWTQQDIALFKGLLEEVNLEKKLNKELKQRVYSVSGKGVGNGVTVQLIVDRNGKIQANQRVSAPGNRRNVRVAATASVPLRFSARADWEKCKRIKFGIGSKRICGKHHEDTGGALTVHVKSQVTANANCQVSSTTNANFTWNEKPSIKIGPVHIRISSIAGGEIQKQLGRLSGRMNNILKEKVQKALREDEMCEAGSQETGSLGRRNRGAGGFPPMQTGPSIYCCNPSNGMKVCRMDYGNIGLGKPCNCPGVFGQGFQCN